MKLQELLNKRSEGKCELCKAENNVTLYEVLPQQGNNEDDSIMICGRCKAQIDRLEEPDSKHWSCLSETIWSEVPGIQVISWRMLNRFRNESWATENLDIMYLDDENLAWAKATGDHENDTTVHLHKDSNGTILQTGDIVIITKSLDVKGYTLNAKLGTVVKNIRLVPENTEQIEGKIEGQVIVILTKYVRKQTI